MELNKSRLPQKKSSPQIVSVFTTALQEKLVNSDVRKLQLESRLELMPHLGGEFIFKALAGVTVLIDRAVSRVRVIKRCNSIQNTPRLSTT